MSRNKVWWISNTLDISRPSLYSKVKKKKKADGQLNYNLTTILLSGKKKQMGVTKLFLQIHRIYEGLERIILLRAVNLKDILRLIGGNLTRFK